MCGDSKKDKKKTRLVLLTNREPSMVYCHNCGYSKPAVIFIKAYYPHAYDSVIDQIFESFKDDSIFKEPEIAVVEDDLNSSNEFSEIVEFLDNECVSLANESFLNEEEKGALSCLRKRKISESIIKELFYCSSEKHREYRGYIVIPYYNEFDIPYYFQARCYRVGKGSPRYITSKFDCCPNKAIYNEKRADPEKTVIILEGIIDSMNVENSVSVSGCGVSNDMIDYLKNKFLHRIWLNDNDEPGNDFTEKLLKLGEPCFIWPKEIRPKDINAFAVSLKKETIPVEWIVKNTYNGIQGLMRLV